MKMKLGFYQKLLLLTIAQVLTTLVVYLLCQGAAAQSESKIVIGAFTQTDMHSISILDMVIAPYNEALYLVLFLGLALTYQSFKVYGFGVLALLFSIGMTYVIGNMFLTGHPGYISSADTILLVPTMFALYIVKNTSFLLIVESGLFIIFLDISIVVVNHYGKL